VSQRYISKSSEAAWSLRRSSRTLGESWRSDFVHAALLTVSSAFRVLALPASHSHQRAPKLRRFDWRQGLFANEVATCAHDIRTALPRRWQLTWLALMQHPRRDLSVAMTYVPRCRNSHATRQRTTVPPHPLYVAEKADCAAGAAARVPAMAVRARQALRRGAADFVALLAKHEDVLIRPLKRGLSAWRAAQCDNESRQFLKYVTLSERAAHGSRTEE
jgi:hypothetical protein